jgi:hypothetical protein
VTKYGPESWTLNKDVGNRLYALERKVLSKMFEGIKENENWRKRYYKGLMQLF